MQRFLFVAFLFVAGTVWGQSSPPPAGQQPIRQQPLQTPPKWVTQNGVPVQPNVQTDNRTLPPGYGSPYPTGVQAAVPQPGSVYGLPPQREPQLGQVAGPPPVYVAQTHPAVAGPGGRQHMGRAEPESRIVPFVLTPAEQKELDEFLVRWEQFSNGIKNLEVDFTSYEYDPFLNPDNRPTHSTFGIFKYAAPNRFVYHVEGQWVDGKAVKGGAKEEKIIIDGNTILDYRFKSKEVHQYSIDPELLARGFADSPLPIIFGAKADEMKKRFSMKIDTAADYRDSQIWLKAVPLLTADQQEFLGLEIRINKQTLRATALKKDDINGKVYTVFVLSNHRINSPFASIKDSIQRDVPRDMTLVVKDMPLPQPQEGRPRTAGPFPISPPNPENEIKLY